MSTPSRFMTRSGINMAPISPLRPGILASGDLPVPTEKELDETAVSPVLIPEEELRTKEVLSPETPEEPEPEVFMSVYADPVLESDSQDQGRILAARIRQARTMGPKRAAPLMTASTELELRRKIKSLEDRVEAQDEEIRQLNYEKDRLTSKAKYAATTLEILRKQALKSIQIVDDFYDRF